MSNSKAWNVFIQWKGTDVCMDFICPDCEYHGHIDGFFCYAVKCGECGSRFLLGTEVSVEKIATENVDYNELCLVSE